LSKKILRWDDYIYGKMTGQVEKKKRETVRTISHQMTSSSIRTLSRLIGSEYEQIKFLDLFCTNLYNSSHSEVVYVPRPDREGDDWWKSPQGNNVEVV